MLEIYYLVISLFILQRTDAGCYQQAEGVYVFGPSCLMCHCKKSEEQCDDTTGECTSGCAKFWYGPGCQYRDIAESEFSRHSDNLPEGQLKYSYLANDGDPKTCSYTAGINSNTKKNVKPFWRVLLPTNETIRELQIVTLPDTLQYFTNFRVFVEYLSPAQKEVETYAPTYSRECHTHGHDAPTNESFTVLCDSPEVRNQVKIELAKLQTQLVLCDVRINGGRNLAFKREASQSSAHRDCIRNDCTADNSVDGIDKSTDFRRCSFIDGKDPWLKVNLGQIAMIRHIRILPFKVGEYANYEVQLSNTTTGQESIIYNGYVMQSESKNISLYTAAEIVTITRKGNNVRLSICEVKVFGDCVEDMCGYRCSEKCHCKDSNIWDRWAVNCSSGCKGRWKGTRCDQLDCATGMYGTDCSESCSGQCKGGYDSCRNRDGICLSGCNAGWQGQRCDQGCGDGTYGINCSEKCSGNCFYGKQCNKVDGSCPNGCDQGFFGATCNRKCSAGRYGINCSGECSSHCKNGAKYTCNHVNGSCYSGCEAGWKGQKCDQGCGDGTYGINCSEKCNGNCFYGKQCNKVDGSCPNGCDQGFFGATCNQRCGDGTYGINCSEKCSGNCFYGKQCNKVDGSCPNGCDRGFCGATCNQKCSAGSYGINCSRECSSHCKNGAKYTCNHVNGSCYSGCEAGWKGQKCDQECDGGSFSQGCANTCSLNCKDDACDKENGQCSRGCKPGYIGQKCEQKCMVGFYGDECMHNCSGHCEGGFQMCTKIDGHCPSGCIAGWKGTKCDTECDDGFYGVNCATACGNCKSGTVCDKVVGTCHKGCEGGFNGDTCLQALQNSDDYVWKIAVGVAAPVFIVVLATAIGVVSYKRKKHGERKENHNETVELPDAVSPHASTSCRKARPGHVEAATNSVANIISTNEVNIYKNDPSQTNSAISLSNLLAYVKGNLADANNFSKQFQEIPYGMKHPSTIAVKPSNIGKNRYKEMYAYDHTRVILKALPKVEGSDYINANFIKGHFKDQAYIATQGPIESTIDDFWRMIWEKNIYTIAMVTNLVEETKMKCLQYWPAVESSARYGDYTVYTESEIIYADFAIRKFKVSWEEQAARKISQFNFTAWPDKSVPRSTSSLLQFWRKVRRNDINKSHTWLVHCSAGVGRTGTFIAMDILYDQGKKNGSVDVYQCVRELRGQRVNMVQTKDQYIFLHGLMLEAFILPSEPVRIDNFHQVVKDLSAVDQDTGKTKFLSQYEIMKEVVTLIKDENMGKFSAAKLEENKRKNRYKSILPPNEFRPFLITNIPGCTNYINAVYIPSYCSEHCCIITQKPLENTAIDCCRLVYEQEVKVIVTFPDNVKKQVGKYLPENGTINLGPFTVTKISEEDKNSYMKKTFVMAYNSEECQLTQLMYKCWPADSITPSDPETMLHFMQEVECNRRAADNKPVLVQCLDGSEKSGLFATLMNILEHARLDNEVSIPQVIRQLRVRRQQLIPNFEQFKFCYDVLLCHVESNAMYANM